MIKNLTIITIVSAIVGMTKADCWANQLGHKCCTECSVVLENNNGKWGIENGEWCGIVDEICEAEKQMASTSITSITTPIFSMESGYYEAIDGLTLSLNSTGTIYYTLDSSDPTTSSTAIIYDSAIPMYDRSNDENVYSKYQYEEGPYSIMLKTEFIANTANFDKATVVRAATKFADGSFSPVVTKTFFVMDKEKLAFYSEIPVVSLVTDPSNLFDKDKGIYVSGQQYVDWKNSADYDSNKSEYDSSNLANFYSKGKEWERPASFTLFRNGEEQISQDVGIRIKGASTRNAKTKSFNIYARKKYGNGKVEFPLIEDNPSIINGKNIDKYDSFGLRAVEYIDRYREPIVQAALKDYPILATYDITKTVVFIDGEFWGTYDIIEKASAYCIQSNYKIPADDVALIKNEEVEEGTEEDLQSLYDLNLFCLDNDLSIDANYQYVSSQMDMDSLIYSYATGLYLGTWDWPNKNYFVWKNKGNPIEGNPYSDGKWRFGAFDFDYSVGLTYDSFGDVPGYAHETFQKFDGFTDKFPTTMFMALLKNPEFRQKFIDTFYFLGETVFEAEKMKNIIEDQKKYLKYYNLCSWRWQSSPTEPLEEYIDNRMIFNNQSLDDMTEFFEKRPQYIYKYMYNYLGIPEEE